MNKNIKEKEKRKNSEVVGSEPPSLYIEAMKLAISVTMAIVIALAIQYWYVQSSIQTLSGRVDRSALVSDHDGIPQDAVRAVELELSQAGTLLQRQNLSSDMVVNLSPVQVDNGVASGSADFNEVWNADSLNHVIESIRDDMSSIQEVDEVTALQLRRALGRFTHDPALVIILNELTIDQSLRASEDPAGLSQPIEDQIVHLADDETVPPHIVGMYLELADAAVGILETEAASQSFKETARNLVYIFMGTGVAAHLFFSVMRRRQRRKHAEWSDENINKERLERARGRIQDGTSTDDADAATENDVNSTPQQRFSVNT